jgi:pyruvate,water dikinase
VTLRKTGQYTMTLTQLWGALLLFIICPLVGGLPLIGWITKVLTKRRLDRVGTGNLSVSAAFYHGGRLIGSLAVLSEALKGIAVVLLARVFFPPTSEWELIALIALVMGRYWFGKGAGTTNVVWGYIVHDWLAAALVFLIGGIGFTILRERQQGRFGILVLFPLITALRHPDEEALIGAAIALAGMMGLIYMNVPDDLDLNPEAGHTDSQAVFKFFRGDRAVRSLNDPLDAKQFGNKVATLAHLKRLGYPVPMGWVLCPGDDPDPLIQLMQPSAQTPLVVRSSAVGEDTEQASAAGQYDTILNVTNRDQLQPAITHCLASYDHPAAVQYRRDRNVPDAAMAVLIQTQVWGAFSGVAFSRDPIARQGDWVVIEALPGTASQVVSGQTTPESYRVLIPAAIAPSAHGASDWILPDDLTLDMHGTGDVPPRLIQQVAFLARHLEAHYHGIPQDIEWSYDGHMLWLLQARPITTLLPIWTRKIAAEVIPGLIHPLTWSINCPLTCGVWADLFARVLGNRARGLDFTATATLHYSRAYFNGSLLGTIFRRMGLPPESLEVLTRGTKFSPPSLVALVQNAPGLFHLMQQELQLETNFRRDDRHLFAPALAELAHRSVHHLVAPDLLIRIQFILDVLRSATYYSILAPLSLAWRQAIAKVPDHELDQSDTPEVAALRSLQEMAAQKENDQPWQEEEAFNQWLDRYGYLSEVGTDIAVPTWKENPQPMRELFQQFCRNPPPSSQPQRSQGRHLRDLQKRVRLKGNVTEVYSRLLAELRWSVVALERIWLDAGWLTETGDIFFLEIQEIQHLVQQQSSNLEILQIQAAISDRKLKLERDRQLDGVPFLVYGNDPPTPVFHTDSWQASQRLQGIGASPGQAEGRVTIVRNLQTIPDIDQSTILVVPYTDSGWAPLLARAGGLIAEVGGRLSHGAIVAREYRIPAVMDVHNATQFLRDGQRVRIDGQQGTVEIL